ncbi:CDP-alcohol phosphatidyltransferase family protein [Pinisolibacter sp.]|uniref:CDP-alcohol phosphatidyltransferase family protein n=1 Tax=Pinisolibacter sp. TaxID=2172024 RepID=UPI002FDE0C56
MIDGLFKTHIDPLWERAARPLAATGVTPNQVTLIGLVLVAVNVAAFSWHRSTLVLGLGLIVAFAFDALDGAVARLTGLSSRRGGYLDAVVDRYQELAMMLALGWASGAWMAAIMGLAGAYLTSYAKARTAIEIPVDNDRWPDLFERQERILFLCGLMILAGTVFRSMEIEVEALTVGMWIYAGLTQFTALQRAHRAWTMLKQADETDPLPKREPRSGDSA